MGGIREQIPPSEIQAVVAIEFFVVHIVMGGRGMPFENRMIDETFREQLVAQMAQNIVAQIVRDENENSCGVSRYRESDNRQYCNLNRGFHRVKSVGGPRRWIGGKMTSLVDVFENSFPVKQPMRPIKIGVVQYQHQDDAEPEIACPIVGNIEINQRPTFLRRVINR